MENQDFLFKKEATKSVADKGGSNPTKATCRSIENVQMYFLMPIKAQVMFPEKSSIKIGCPLIELANEITLNTTFHKEPKIFIIHRGTNDLERLSPDDIQEKLINLCDIIRKNSQDVESFCHYCYHEMISMEKSQDL